MRRVIERRPPPSSAVAKKRELRNGKNRSACIRDGSVHLSGFVFEYPQLDDLPGKPLRVFQGIILFDTEQGEYAGADSRVFIPINNDAGLRDPLNHCSHGCVL